jgi:hypothetical protein
VDNDLPQQQLFQAMENLYSPVTPLTQVRIPPLRQEQIEFATSCLSAHSCTLDVGCESILLTFPPGTTKQELYPRINDTRYRVTFPDGWEIRLTEHRHSVHRLSTIALPVEDTH